MIKWLDYFRQTFWVAMFAGYLIPYIQIKNSMYNLNRDCAAYITSSYICEKIIFYLYYQISLVHNSNFFVLSGVILTVLLIISGRLIELVYYNLRKHKKMKMKESLSKADKVFIMGAASFISALDVLALDYRISLLCISLLLGKYFWIDSGILTIRDNYKKIKHDWNNINKTIKDNVALFGCILVISDVLGIILHLQVQIEISAYALSSVFVILLSVVYILAITIKHKRDK